MKKHDQHLRCIRVIHDAALREHPRQLAIQALEEPDREGYSKQPQLLDEALAWEAEAFWPAE